MTGAIQSRADRDRIRQKAADANRRRRTIERVVDRIVREYLVEHRSAEACMADLIRAAKGER